MIAQTMPRRRSPLRAFIDWNSAAASALDRALLPASWSVRGGREFIQQIVPSLLKPGMHIWDVGCGSRPFVDPATKQRLGLTITGTDIDQGELDKMPLGSCDTTITADLCTYRGDGSADLVICKAVLEHVENVDQAVAGLASLLRPGGLLAIRVPCRNAWFARINLILPEEAKRRLLFSLHHADDGHTGFPARYDRCTPAQFVTLAQRHGLEIVDLRTYWHSPSFYFLLPLWATWRIWQAFAKPIAGDAVCEGFVMVARASNARPSST